MYIEKEPICPRTKGPDISLSGEETVLQRLWCHPLERHLAIGGLGERGDRRRRRGGRRRNIKRGNKERGRRRKKERKRGLRNCNRNKKKLKGAYISNKTKQ